MGNGKTGHTAYANFKHYALRYDLAAHTFDVWYAPAGKVAAGAALAHITNPADGSMLSLAAYPVVEHHWAQNMEDTTLTVTYGGGPARLPQLGLLFVVSGRGVRCRVDARGDMDYVFTGRLHLGADMEHDTFAMRQDGQHPVLRSAFGPAASTADDLLFDRRTDRSLEFVNYHKLQLAFDWGEKCYTFTTHTEGNDYARGFTLRGSEDVYARRFGIPYRCINKRNTFPTPPCGWMTWYATQFGANEETVLENARWQKENLADYGATAVWVDWEWYHSRFGGVGPEGVHAFAPDETRYPHGMAHLADEIKKLGLVPALWVGVTNEPVENTFIEENPGAVLVQQPSWCGQYFFDPTCPAYLEEYVPKAFEQFKGWGYQALKWDCMPITLAMLDQYHDRLHNSALTSEAALRAVIQAARDTLGEEVYLLSCAGDTVRDITAFIDIFDAARIGGDIFEWSEFVSMCVQRVMKFYALHNVVHYNDPDNLILRPELNTFEHARSRAALLALLGLPVTLGDELARLPRDRVELLRRILPALDIHPMDIREMAHDLRVLKVNLAVERPFGRWNVVNVLNLLEQAAEATVHPEQDLHLPPGEYLVYDYWDEVFMGVFSGGIPLEIGPFATKTLAVHSLEARPQLLSTSRHITQGAAELEDMAWDEERRALCFTARLVKNDPYRVALHVPEGWRPAPDSGWREASPRVWSMEFMPGETGPYSFEIIFDTM